MLRNILRVQPEAEGGGSQPEQEWRKIKQTFLMLEEWFEDRVLYHVVGFLVNEEMSIGEISRLSKHCTKSEFEQKLRREVSPERSESSRPETCPRTLSKSGGRRIGKSPIRCPPAKNQSYLAVVQSGDSASKQSSNLRFQFDSFKSERWNIEHVRSVSSDKPDTHLERETWLTNCLGYLSSQKAEEALRAEIEAFVALPHKDALDMVFDPLYDKLLEFFKEKAEEEADHGVANLALLDEHTNKSLQKRGFCGEAPTAARPRPSRNFCAAMHPQRVLEVL